MGRTETQIRDLILVFQYCHFCVSLRQSVRVLLNIANEQLELIQLKLPGEALQLGVADRGWYFYTQHRPMLKTK